MYKTRSMVRTTALGVSLLACATTHVARTGVSAPRRPAPDVAPALPLPVPDDAVLARVVEKPDKEARLLTKTDPLYPDDALRQKVQGEVDLEIVIDETGRVSRWRLLKSIPELDVAAIRCVLQWRFAPAELGGRPVATRATAPVFFHMK
jgi:periplasmic protein TonB